MGFGSLITAELDQSSAAPIQLCAHIADHPVSLRLGCYESQILDYVEKIAIQIFFEVVNMHLDIDLKSVACSLKRLANRANLKLSLPILVNIRCRF